MRECAWCRGPIPANLRADAVCCSVRCRQARHRFTTGVGTAPPALAASGPLRLAYADPPYPGLSRRYYGDHPDFAGEVDHPALIRDLAKYDGWALSTSARALQEVLASCPPGVRVASWHRGDRGGRSAGPLNAWEPVIYFGGRRGEQLDASTPARLDASAAAQHDASRPHATTTHSAAAAHDASHTPGRHDASRRTVATRDASRHPGSRRIDSLVYIARARITDPYRVVGAKPAAFCRWIFDLLGAQPHDEFTDVYPGSGGVQRAWEIFSTPALDRMEQS